MLDLSPVKLLVVLVVAMILLGPDKLPQLARQLGAGWRRFHAFREQMDREIRENIPDLPSSAEIARFARSPVALLNQLAEMPSSEPLVEDPGAGVAAPEDAWREDPAANGSADHDGPPTEPAEPTRAVAPPPPMPDDPGLN